MQQLDVPKTHFCAGLFFRQEGEIRYILGLNECTSIDKIGDMNKLPGGTNKNAPWETWEQTLMREFSEETTQDGKDGSGLMPKTFEKACVIPLGNHDKVSYIILEAEGEFGLNEIRTHIEPDGRILRVRWFRIDEFRKKLLPTHKKLFEDGCSKMLELDLAFKF